MHIDNGTGDKPDNITSPTITIATNKTVLLVVFVGFTVHEVISVHVVTVILVILEMLV
jgi:hypothetical protein